VNGRCVAQAFPDAPPMCNDCAFREGSDPNGSVETTMAVVKCLMEDEPFYCHHGVVEGEPKRLCAGFSALYVAGKVAEEEPTEG
jgi:hypothetical protein